MPNLVFKVLVPAMMPHPPQGVVPDHMPRYDGTTLPSGDAPITFGAAVVTGGTRVGSKWMGCTYIRPPYVIPGFGEIEVT